MVCSAVGMGAEELLKQISVGSVELNAIKAGINGKLGGVGKVLNGLFNFFIGKCWGVSAPKCSEATALAETGCLPRRTRLLLIRPALKICKIALVWLILMALAKRASPGNMVSSATLNSPSKPLPDH